MIYLIDGHNLIPHIRGLSLHDLDDEQSLIEILQEFSRVARKKIEVYFDKAPAGQARTVKKGMIVVHFIHEKSTADQAIIRRLRNSGKNARSFCVVTSDHRIQAETRAMHASVIESGTFTKELDKAITDHQTTNIDSSNLSEDELRGWIELFEKRKEN